MEKWLVSAMLLSSPAFAGDTFTYTVAAPFIDAVNPSSGPVGAGVAILGSGFTGATSVKFDGTAAASFTVVNDNAINAVAPVGTGTVVITVTTPAGTNTPPN